MTESDSFSGSAGSKMAVDLSINESEWRTLLGSEDGRLTEDAFLEQTKNHSRLLEAVCKNPETRLLVLNGLMKLYPPYGQEGPLQLSDLQLKLIDTAKMEKARQAVENLNLDITDLSAKSKELLTVYMYIQHAMRYRWYGDDLESNLKV